MTGSLTLIGAGPGDAGLLTLRGLRALQDADVIVADRLGARTVLDQLAADGVQLNARVIDVGKQPGHHPVPQSEINELLVRLVREGNQVVRLKGGDPFVLGRGREEQQHAEAAGIPASVVSGVTSAVSVPALAGIPLTHRGVATAFTVVSGHDLLEPGGPLTRSKGDHTVVLLMAVGTLPHVAHVLADGERGGDCPVAIVEDGFGPGQRVTFGTLATIAARAAARRVRNPAVIVVGDVVRLSPDAAAWLPVEAEHPASAQTASGPVTAPPAAAPPASAAASAAPWSPRSAFSRWVDALDAGLAVDSGAILTGSAELESDSVPSPRKARS